MATPLEDIRNKLIADGLVEGATGWKCYLSFLPDNKNITGDKVVVIYETGSDRPETKDLIEYDYPNFMIHVRGTERDYATVRAKGEEIYIGLHKAAIVNFVYFYSINSSPNVLIDNTSRYILTYGFRSMRLRSSSIEAGVDVPYLFEDGTQKQFEDATDFLFGG